MLECGYILSLITLESMNHEIQKKGLLSEDATKKSWEDIPSRYSDALSTGIAGLSCRICNYFTFNGGLIYLQYTKTITFRPKKSLINDITFGQDVVYNIIIVKRFSSFF